MAIGRLNAAPTAAGRICALLALLAWCAGYASDSRSDNVEGLFDFSGTTYSVTATFNVHCPPDTLLSVFHKFHHIQKYLTRRNLVVTPLEEGQNWNRYLYVYTYVVYSCSLTFRRDVVPDSGLLRFGLEQSRASVTSLPRVRNTIGYYRVETIPNSDSLRTTYYQRTVMTKRILWLYRKAIRLETNGFLRRMVRYIDGLEQKPSQE